MENYTVILLIMALMIGVSGLAEKMKIAVPILLLLAGIAIGFAPTIPDIEINPDVIMLLFLPPLLYDAAFNISWDQFRINSSTITTLAIGLVFLTTAGIAVLAYYLIPGMTWPLAFVLGAILSATDAVAALGITKGLGLPHNVVTILEGESLLNDASALVAYRFAVAAVGGIAFGIWKASLQFLLVLGGGFAIGVAITMLLMMVIRFFKKNDMVVISLMLLMPFVTYLVAEHFHVSGVISVVVLGLGMSRLSREKFPDGVKNQSKHFWDVLVFILNGLVFLLIGINFPVLMHKMEVTKVWTYIGYGFLIALTALVIRIARVFLQQMNIRRAFVITNKNPRRTRKVSEEALFDSNTSVIISWAGMRGIISLAIAIGLPITLEDGTPFPMRDEIIFLCIAVVLITLLGQGLTLPWVVRKFSTKTDLDVHT